jgi:hypothetical protein
MSLQKLSSTGFLVLKWQKLSLPVNGVNNKINETK